MLHDPSLALNAHVKAVRLLAGVGVPPPEEWVQLEDRLASFTALTLSGGSQQALTDAIISGRKADLGTLHVLALAETLSDTVARATVRKNVVVAVLAELRALYATSAVQNYKAIADKFDAIASTLTAGAKVVDVEADPEQVVNAGDKVRSAWSSALLAARDLDTMLPLLVQAADLAGVAVTTDEARLALSVDPGGVSRREVWAAHDAEPGRCGRWSRMLAAGCTIRAHRDLETFEPYRRPAPMQEKWIQTGRGQHQRTFIDPESTVNTPA